MGKVPDDIAVHCNCSMPPLQMIQKKSVFGVKTFICTACLKQKEVSMSFGELHIKEK